MAAEKSNGQSENSSGGWLEWLASGTGLVLAVGVIGYLVWSGLTASDGPPVVEVQLQRVVESQGGYVAEVTAANRAAATAANVVVKGELKRDGRTVESSQAEFGYVPGHARRNGGLYFKQDPNAFELELRALGYTKP